MLVLGSRELIAQNPLDSLADESDTQWRKFDDKAIDVYRNDSDFVYERVKKPETYTFWDYFWALIKEFFKDSERRSVFEILIYIVSGGVMIYVITRLLGISPRQLFYGKKSDNTVKTTITEEDIAGMDFDARVETAEQAENWEEAIRYLYLKILKSLALRELILWKIDKTNHDYEIEIKEQSLKKPFMNVTNIYERICYGNFPIESRQYHNFKKQFIELNTSVEQVPAL